MHVSVQALLDCSGAGDCLKGGLVHEALLYSEKSQVIPASASPYQEYGITDRSGMSVKNEGTTEEFDNDFNKEECNSLETQNYGSQSIGKIKGIKYVKQNDTTQLKAALVTGPVAVSVDSSSL